VSLSETSERQVGDRRDGDGTMALLLEEYRALRAEVDQRMASRSQLLGFLGASAALGLGIGGKADWRAWALCAFLGAVLGLYWLRSGLLLRKISHHLAGLEGRINLLAGDGDGTGEPALTWHSQLPRWEVGK